MRRVVITGTLGTMTKYQLDTYTELIQSQVPDAEVVLLDDTNTSIENFIKNAKGASIIINQFQEMDMSVYEALSPELIGVCASGIGTNALDVESATKMGVPVANAPDYCVYETASQAVSMILEKHRRLIDCNNYVKDGGWAGNHAELIEDARFSQMTVGLYGFGNIPRSVATMLQGFGCKIIASDPYVDQDTMSEYRVTKVDFDRLVKESDYLSLHAPLLPSTQGAFGYEQFENMKESAILINTGRGGLVDPEALYDALSTGKIRGASIDTFITEPPTGIEAKIAQMDNVVATPHIGYYSTTATEKLIHSVAQNAVDFLRGLIPRSVVNPEVYENCM